MEDRKHLLSIGEASEYLGVSIDTLRRWERKGRIVPYRSPGDHRYYEKYELDKLFGKRYTRDEPAKPRSLNLPTFDEPEEQTPLEEIPEQNATKEEHLEVQKPVVEEISTEEVVRESPSIIDRPPKEITIPKQEPIRIVSVQKEYSVVTVEDIPPKKPSISEIDTLLASGVPEESIGSILTPKLMSQQIPALENPSLYASHSSPQSIPHTKTKKQKTEMLTTLIIASVLILVVILGVLLFIMLLRSSQSVLSPTP